MLPSLLKKKSIFRNNSRKVAPRIEELDSDKDNIHTNRELRDNEDLRQTGETPLFNEYHFSTTTMRLKHVANRENSDESEEYNNKSQDDDGSIPSCQDLKLPKDNIFNKEEEEKNEMSKGKLSV